MDINILKKIGFSDKTSLVYLALLRLGPSSVRNLAKIAELNRGTVYESLKWLQDEGLVDFYEKDAKQYFVAEDPERLTDLAIHREEELRDIGKKLTTIIPELKSIHNKGGERPVAKYFEKNEINQILEDILATCESSEEREYRIYSVSGIREHLYRGFETFSDARVAKGIKVKVIAIGGGGELRGLDERKWLDAKVKTPTYILIYPGKTAYISLNAKNEPVGVVIENDGVYQTQKTIFDELWGKL